MGTTHGLPSPGVAGLTALSSEIPGSLVGLLFPPRPTPQSSLLLQFPTAPTRTVVRSWSRRRGL